MSFKKDTLVKDLSPDEILGAIRSARLEKMNHKDFIKSYARKAERDTVKELTARRGSSINTPYAFISFTDTFRAFYNKCPYHTLETFFEPGTKFYFGCQRGHLCLDYNLKEIRKYRSRMRVPFEITWAPSEDIIPTVTDPKKAIMFHKLPEELATAWSQFLGVLRAADAAWTKRGDKRLFFGGEWDELGNDYPTLAKTLSDYGDVHAVWGKRSFPAKSHQYITPRKPRTVLKNLEILNEL